MNNNMTPFGEIEVHLGGPSVNLNTSRILHWYLSFLHELQVFGQNNVQGIGRLNIMSMIWDISLAGNHL